MCEQEKCHWKKLYVSSFEIFYFYLNHKENKVQFFTEHFQTKNNLLYKNGGYRVAIRNSVTVRSMWIQTSWNILFYQIFVSHMSSKESIVFISFHNKTWRYDDVTTALWQNQIIVILYSIFLKCLNIVSCFVSGGFYSQQRLMSFGKTKTRYFLYHVFLSLL